MEDDEGIRDPIPESEFSFHEKLGGGTYAEVFRASWRGDEVAVKQFRKIHEDPEAIADEIELMSQLGKHQNICRYLGWGYRDGAGTIILEYYKDGCLDDYLYSSKLGIDRGLRMKHSLLKQIVLGMVHLNSKGIVHRDLKPGNILLKENYRNAVISDFGFAKKGIVGPENYFKSLKGTVIYQAPEITKGEVYTDKCDVYSFGLMLWEVLSGKIPFRDLSQRSLYRYVVQDEKNLPEKAIPAEYRQLYLDCLERDVEVRPSFSVILERLNAIEVAQRKLRG